MTEINVDVIKSLKTLKGKISSDQFNSLLSSFGLTEEDFENRITGLNKEYEFLCNLYLCDLANNIIPIDEKFTTAVGEKSCDAIVELKDGKKIMIEVKSTKENKYSISSGNFEKRVKWAKNQGYELYFAINIFNYWTLFSDNQMRKWNRKVSEKQLAYSKLSTVLGVNYYIVNNVKMISHYTDLIVKQSLNIYDSDSNYFSTKEQFFVDDNLVDEITPTNMNNLPFVLLSEALKTRSKMTKNILNPHDYTITYELIDNHIISIFEIYKESITHMTGNDDGDKYESFMAMIAEDQKRREYLKNWLNALAKLLKMQVLTLIPSPNSN